MTEATTAGDDGKWRSMQPGAARMGNFARGGQLTALAGDDPQTFVATFARRTTDTVHAARGQGR